MSSMQLLDGLLIACASLAAIFVILQAAIAIRVYFKFRGQRLVTCPADRSAAAVRVAAGCACAGSLTNKPSVQLQECSHWPERGGCSQGCLPQIENDPYGSLLWNQVQQWYRGRSCAFCHQPIEKVEWHDHRPALLGPDQKTIQWNTIAPERLPEVFETCLPVCWSCHIAETFRREHPDRVIDRADHPERLSLYH